MTKLERLVTIVVGSFLIWMGMHCIGEGCAWHGVPMPGISGYLMSAIGAGVIVCGVVIKSVVKRPDGYLICSECRSVFPVGDLSGTTCPKCAGHLEDLKGFYKRHPELRDDDRGK